MAKVGYRSLSRRCRRAEAARHLSAAGAGVNGAHAPKPAVRRATIEPPESTLSGPSLPLLRLVGSALQCESTARDAMMLNYKVFFVSDANACRTDEDHNATLGIMMVMFADVRSTDEMIALLERHAAPLAGAAE
jgi:hypothetical protein